MVHHDAETLRLLRRPVHRLRVFKTDTQLRAAGEELFAYRGS